MKRAFPASRWRREAAKDFNDAADVIAHIYLSERAQYLWSSLLWLETEELIEQEWPGVLSLADALVKRRTLNGREAAAAIVEGVAR